MVQGLTNPQIAKTLGISVATVKRHIAHIMMKLNCTNRAHLAARLIQDAIVSLPGGAPATPMESAGLLPYTPAYATATEGAG